MPPAPREAPSFRALLAANVRVLTWLALAALLAWGVWRGLRWLFPDVPWLRGGSLPG